MIKVELVETFGWKAAIRGMRNPMNSWNASDSTLQDIGRNDRQLMQKLCKSGASHRKFLRMIHAQFDVVAPLYWWKEFETYKIGTVSNSCSTMHKITSKCFSAEDFSTDRMCADKESAFKYGIDAISVFNDTLETLNYYRNAYIKEKGHNDELAKNIWYTIIQLLPSSYNQRRTIDTNYEVLRKMYSERKNHKLYEWREFCNKIEDFPNSWLIIE